jgi:hypothetical protein
MTGHGRQNETFASYGSIDQINPNSQPVFYLERSQVPVNKLDLWKISDALRDTTETVGQYFKQVDTVKNSSNYEQDPFYLASVEFRNQLFNAIEELQLATSQLYNQEKITPDTPQWKRKQHGLLEETKALSDYVKTVCPLQQNTTDASSTEFSNVLKLPSLDDVQKANTAYIDAQPSLSKTQIAKNIAKSALVFGATALACVGVGAICLASCGLFGMPGMVAGFMGVLGLGAFMTSSKMNKAWDLVVNTARSNPLKSQPQKRASQLAKSACAFQVQYNQKDNAAPNIDVSIPANAYA